MIDKSCYKVQGAPWAAFCLMLIFFFNTKSFGQTDPCLAVKRDSISIELTSRLKYDADVDVEVCYTSGNLIQVNIRSLFTRNGRALSEKSLSRRSHQIFLSGITYNLHDLFFVNRALMDSSDFVPQEIHDQATITLLLKKESVYWTDEHLALNLNFLYSIDGTDKVEAILGIIIDLPDHLKKSVSTQPNIADDPVASRLSQTRKPVRTTRRETNISQEPGTDNACLDSIAYHHRQLLNIYREISANPVIDKNKKKLLRKQFEYHNAKFHAFQDSCNLQHSIYNDGYDRIENELQKHLGSNSNDDNSLNRNSKPEKNDGQDSQASSDSISASKLLNYIFVALFLVVVSFYIFSKIKKKKK